MKQLLLFLFAFSIGVLELAGAAPTQQQLHNDTITPQLTMVAIVDGKAFFVDLTVERTRTQALDYCESLGMQLAEIPSANQFSALDQAVVEEWRIDSCVWTGGVTTTGIQRYTWQSRTNTSVDPFIPYKPWLDEDSNYFLDFWKYVNASYLSNLRALNTCSGALCETLSNDNFQYHL